MMFLTSPRAFRRVCSASIAAFLGSLAAPAPILAQTATGWTGLGPDANWSTAANWSSGSPAQFAAPDLIRDLYFGDAFANAGATGSLNSVNDVAGFQGFRITFQVTTLAADPEFVIGGNGFTLLNFDGESPRIENQSSSLQTFSLNGTLTLDGGAAGVAEINPAFGDLLFQNAIELAGDTQLQIFGESGSTVTFSGAISGGLSSSVELNGNSRAVMGAANTYGGDTFVNAGELVFEAGGSLAAGTSIRLGNTTGFESATLTLGTAAGGVTIGNAVDVRAGDAGVRILSSSNTAGTNSLTGGITLGDNLRVDVAAGGTLDINTGAVDVGPQTLTVDGPGTTIISSSIGNSTGDGTVVKTGIGALTLSGVNTFTGSLVLEDGILNVSDDSNLGAASGALFLKGGNLNATGALNMSRTVVLEGASALVTITAGSTWTGALTGSGGFTKNGGGTLTLAGAIANDFAGQLGVNQGTLILDNSGGNAVAAGGVLIASNNTAGFGTAILSLARSEQLDNDAPLSLTANGGVRAGFDLNNFTETVGPVTISSATFGSATIALGANGRLILNGDLTFNANRNAAGNTAREVMITGTGTYATPGPGGTLDLGGVARNIFVNANNAQANSDATIEAEITNGTLVKRGTRVLRLGAVNTFDALVINEGTVRPLLIEAIPAGVPLTVSGTTPGVAAVLDLNNFDFTLTAANALQFGGGAGASTIATGTGTLTLATPIAFDLSNNSQTLTVSGNLNLNGVQDTFNVGDSAVAATDVVISAVISGSSTGLTKTGAGTLALSGSNTYTGPVTINGGALAPRAANAFGGSVTVNAGATLQMDTGGADSAAFNSFFGAATNTITIEGGTFRGASNSDRTITGRAVNIGAAGATFDIVGNYNNFTEAGVTQVRFAAGGIPSLLNGTGPIVKDGGGRIQFQSTSPNYSGPITVNNGTFEANGASMGNSSATNTITINGGNLSLTGTMNQPLVTLNGGALSVTGGSRTANSAVHIADNSYIFLNNFWTDVTSVGPWNLTVTGPVTGSADLLVSVNRPGYTQNAGVLILQNPLNTLSGTVTVGKNLQLTSNPTGGVGSALGTARYVLMDGKLNLRDNGAGSGGSLAYGNDVTVTSPAGLAANGVLPGNPTISVDRASGTNTGNTFELGSLAIEGQQLDVTGANGFRLLFDGETSMTGDATFNVVGTTLTFAGGLSGGANTFTKSGSGTLRLVGPSTYGGFTLLGGVLEVPNEPTGNGRTIALPFGTGFSAGYAATQENLIDRITLDSAGVVALGVDATFNPDFTGFTGGLRLGGSDDATLTGTITPAADAIVRLGGAGGTLTLASPNAISGAVSLNIDISGTTAGTISLPAANLFTGPVSVGGGMTLRIGSNGSLGTGTALSLDAATLQLIPGGNYAGFETRLLTIGAGAATIDTNGADLSIATPIVGSSSLTKLGDGTLTLGDTTATFGGKLIVRGGTVSVSADANFGAVPGAAVADQIQLAGGTLLATGSFTIPANRRIALGAGGGTIEVADGQSLTLASIMSGANPFTKEGSGTLTITADPSVNNLFVINDGVLALQHSGSTDAPFIINDGGTLRLLTTNDLGDAHSVTVNTGGTFDLRASDTISQLLGSGVVLNNHATAAQTLTVNSALSSSFSGTLQNGTSVLNFTKGGGGTVTMTGAHTFTGTALVNSSEWSIEGAEGSLATNTINIGDNNGGSERINFGQVTDVWSSGALNRISNSANVNLNGRARLIYNGPAAASTGFDEVIGTLTVGAGSNMVTLNAAPGADVQLSPNTLTRVNNGTLLLRAESLGGIGAGSTRLVAGNASSFVVGSGAAGTPAVGLVPFMIGDSSATGAGSTFVTTGPNGFRLLSNEEFGSTIAGGAGKNVSLVGGEVVTTSVAVNALRVAGGTTSIAANTRVVIGSGAVLFTGDATISGPGTLDFSGRDGVISIAQNDAPASVELNANLAGGFGLNLGSFGLTATNGVVNHDVLLAGDNTFGGTVTLSGVALRIGSANAFNPLSATPVIFRPGASLSLGGHDLSIRDLGLNSSGGTFVLQNAAADDATLTVVGAANSTWASPITDGAGGGALSLRKIGTSQLILSGTSTFTGTTSLERGTLLLNGSGGRLTNGTIGSQAIEISGGGLLRLDNATNSTDRILNTASMTMRGGTFFLDHAAPGGTNYSETIGALTIAGGANTVMVDQAASANTSSVTFASLAREPGSIVHFTSNAAGALGASTRARVIFSTEPAMVDGLIGGWAYVNDNEFASYNPAGVVSVAAALSTADAETAWGATTNIKPAGSVLLTADRVVNSLNFASGQSLDLGGFSLNVDSGGIIHQTASTADAISNGTLTAGDAAGAELFLRASATGNLTVSAAIVDNSAGAVSLHNSGAGTVTLTGANTYTGPTSVSGTLSIASDAVLGAAPAAPAPGHLKINHGGTLEITAATTLDANRGIAVTGATGTIRQTAGTLTYGGTITSAAHSEITLIGDAILGTLALGGGAAFAGASTVTLTGATQTIGTGLNVGVQTVAGPVTTTNVTYATPGGAMTVGMNAPGGSDINLAYRTVTPVPDSGGTANIARVDLQEAGSFTASVNNVRLGVLTAGASAGGRGELLLPETSTLTVATGIILGDSNAATNGAHQSLLQFGSGLSTVTTPSTVVGGRKGNGRMTVAPGGTVVIAGFGSAASDFSVARNFIGATGVTSTGIADFTGGTLITDLRDLVVAYKDNTGGTGNSGGANGTLTLGDSANNNVRATALRVAEKLSDSSGAVNGTFNIGGGLVAISGDAAAGILGTITTLTTIGSGNATGNINVTGGALEIGGDLLLGTRTVAGNAQAIGNLTLAGGTTTIGGDITTSGSPQTTATVLLDGGALDVTGGFINVNTLTVQSGTLSNVAEIYTGDGATALPALAKNASGTLILAGTNTYTAATNVNAGTLLVTGSISGAVNVAGTGILGGTGSILGDVILASGATVAPGASIGALATGSLEMSAGSVFALEIDSTTRATDLLAITGSLNIALGGTVQLAITDLNPTPFGGPLPFITYTDTWNAGLFSVNGMMIDDYDEFFNPESATITIGGNDYRIDYDYGGNSVALFIPEPSAFLSLLGGLGVLLGTRRRRK